MRSLNKLSFKLFRITRSTLFKSSGIYTISSFINASIPFLLLPILTKHLSQSDFGIVSMFGTVVSFMMPFVGINMEGAIARKFYDEEKEFPLYVGNCISISIISTLIIFVICLIFKDSFSRYSSLPSNLILFSVIICFSQFISLVLLTIYQISIKPYSYGLYQILQSFFNFGISLLFILKFQMKWDGRILAQILSGVLFAVMAMAILYKKKYIRFRIDLLSIIHALKFGGGLIPHALGGLLIILTNRFFLLNLINVSEIGLYSVAMQIGGIISFFTISFNNAFVPWLYVNLKKEDAGIKLKIVKFTYLYFILICIAAAIFYLLVPFLFKLFINPNFYQSEKYLFWIILGFVFQGMYFMVTNYISYAEKTHYQASVTLTIGLLNIPLNYFFIKYLGAVGAGLAFSSCFLLLFIFTWLLTIKVYKMPWLLLNKS